jgi:uncharacterized protein YndB with AHSA1/START domain
MCSREIWHEVLINAAPRDVYEAVTDVEKLAHWWTTETRGRSEVGETLEFWFSRPRPSAVMEVTALKPYELVQWRVIGGGATEWIGTELEFKIFRDEGRTLLHFRHSKWDPNATMFPECSMTWALFLLSLKEFVETGKGRPYPYDLPVNTIRPPTSVSSTVARSP